MNDFKLDNEPKISAGFTIPDDYFTTFSQKVLTKLPQEQPKVISLWDKNKNAIYKVAAVLVLSLSIPVMNNMTKDTNQIYASEIENYLTQNSTLTDDDIIELLSNEDLETMQMNSSLENDDLEAVLGEEANLEDYISN
jgi:hypothetical protein